MTDSGSISTDSDAPESLDGEFWDDDETEFEAKPERINRSLRTLIEWVGVAVGALAVALLIKAFLLQAFYIPSGSMEPTLQTDDRVLVNKLSYRLGDVQRGDIIVFEKPETANSDIEDFIKRVIAVGGETVSLSDGSVFIDGQELIEDYIDGAQTLPKRPIQGCDNPPADDTCTVPEGHVFVMGDNRGGSSDSREFGPIPEDDIVGRAFLKVWPLGDLGFL